MRGVGGCMCLCTCVRVSLICVCQTVARVHFNERGIQHRQHKHGTPANVCEHVKSLICQNQIYPTKRPWQRICTYMCVWVTRMSPKMLYYCWLIPRAMNGEFATILSCKSVSMKHSFSAHSNRVKFHEVGAELETYFIGHCAVLGVICSSKDEKNPNIFTESIRCLMHAFGWGGLGQRQTWTNSAECANIKPLTPCK